jgi:acetyl esterase/lipase
VSSAITSPIVLEPAAQLFADEAAVPPYLFELGPQAGREALDDVQSGSVAKPEAEIIDTFIPAGPRRETSVRIVRPLGTTGHLPAILYMHGAGWVFGDSLTHDRLIRELAVGTGAAVLFPNYSRAPEARYPVAIEEGYATLAWYAEEAADQGLDSSRLAIAGDSVGGNMAAAITLMAKQRLGPRLAAQVLFYPVTDASFDTASYQQFAEGHHLRRDAMQWFWDQAAIAQAIWFLRRMLGVA